MIEPRGALPQAAQRLDAVSPLWSNEVGIRVDTLNIDSASFAQLVGDVGRSAEAIEARIVEIVGERGKMQNPVTGSGGMLLGTVDARGADYDGPAEIVVGARVATLVSLTLTPLRLERVSAVHVAADQVSVEGYASLPPSAPIVVMPTDLDPRVALAALDVCGAPAQVARLARPGMRVAIIGAGKSGVLCMAQARATMGATGRIVAVDIREGLLPGARGAGLIDAWACCDARDPLAASRAITAALGGEADLVVNTANVSDTEMTAIMSARAGGTVYYFNMATSFSRAALGSEGVGRDVTLIIGNGFVPGHADLTLGLVRTNPFVHATLAAAVGAA